MIRFLLNIKSCLIALRRQYYRICLGLRNRVEIGANCTILPLPRIRMMRGSRISLGTGCTLLSSSRYNPLIRDVIRLHTFSPHAFLEIGDRVGISGSHIACCEHITIGDDTIIGPDCLIFDWKAHDYEPKRGWAGRLKIQGKAIMIGKRCYIGTRCIILKGVHLGDDCVIAAGTLVNRDVPARHLAFGNPMRTKQLG